jgi:ferredoxin
MATRVSKSTRSEVSAARELLGFARRQRVRLGWFRSRQFSSYLRVIEERTEYHGFAYRPLEVFQAAGLRANARSVIVLAVNYLRDRRPEPDGFRLSNYSRFCGSATRAASEAVMRWLVGHGWPARPVDVPGRAAACVAGLGSVGRNTLFYADGLGSFVGIAALETEVELPETGPGCEQVMNPACLQCHQCVRACPTGAISAEGFRIDPLRCISFINRHADEPGVVVPADHSKLKRWLHGCEVCQEVCPLNARQRGVKGMPAPAELNLYGMTVPNQSTIAADLLRERMSEITSPGYRLYVETLLSSEPHRACND